MATLLIQKKKPPMQTQSLQLAMLIVAIIVMVLVIVLIINPFGKPNNDLDPYTLNRYDEVIILNNNSEAVVLYQYEEDVVIKLKSDGVILTFKRYELKLIGPAKKESL